MGDRGSFKREGIYVYTQLMHFVVQRKITQHCKAIIFQEIHKWKKELNFSSSSLSVDVLCWVLSRFSGVRLFATLWTIALHSPLSRGFSRQEYWSGLPCSPPGDLPDPGIKPRSLALQGDSLLSESRGKPLTVLLKQLDAVLNGK